MADLIDRQAAIEALKKYEELESNNFTETSPIIMMTVATIANCIEEIVTLPSAQPERKKGKWDEKKVIEDGNIIKEWQSARCSVCGRYHTTPYMYYFDNYKFCPNCGTNMVEGEDDE